MSSTRAFLAVTIVVAAAAGAGCDNRLTPEQVRELIAHPKGTVSKDTMSSVTGDLFQADKATSLEDFASVLKIGQSSSSGANAIPGVSAGAIESAGDVFCVGGLVASIASFDGCHDGDDCHAQLTIDSCVLRVGDEGDDDAKGKIEFKIDSSSDDKQDKADLSLNFSGWQSSHDDDTIDGIDGLIALETLVKHGEAEHADVVFSSDIDARVVKKEHGFFEDGVVEHTKVRTGLQFVGDTTDTSASGTLNILAFTDDNGDESNVVISFASQTGHQVDAAGVTSASADAQLSVIGENGTFACTWSSTSESGSPEGDTVKAEGSCTDSDGESFSWSGSSTSEH